MLEFVPFPLLAGLPILAILLFFLRRRYNPAYLVCLAAFGLYLLFLAGMIVFPMPLPGSFARSPATVILSRVNLTPFDFGNLFDNSLYIIIHEILGNILVLVPFGFGLPFLVNMKPGVFIPICFGAGLVFETTQLILSLWLGASYRSVDVNDVLLNALGALAGYGLYLGMLRVYPRIFSRFRIL